MTNDEIKDICDSIANLFFEWERAADTVESRQLRQKMERHFALAHAFFTIGIELMNQFDPDELFCRGDNPWRLSKVMLTIFLGQSCPKLRWYKLGS